MAQNKLKLFSLGLASIILSTCLTGCSNEEVLTIRVLTSEDYIYVADDGVTTLNDYFEDWYEEEYGEKIKVSYETTDTNETMYNLLKTGKTHYDLMCTSDYIVQKLAAEKEIEVIDLDQVPSYRDYASKYIDSAFRTAFELPDGCDENDTYAVGYMWGTLGLIFNPEYDDFAEEAKGAKAIHDATSWNMLWMKDYSHTASIKDSMRDTFAVATMKAFEEQTACLREKYLNNEIDSETYNKELNKIFNFVCESDLDQNKLNSVQKALVSLKKNSFGLEVDSGKQDIVTGKIGINLAWSGDATNAMWEAEDNGDVDLVYSLPENGSNLWLDAWVMPKYEERDQKVHDAAMAYLNYLSTPENAALNMSYVGYTSFIAGDEVVDYIVDNFDARCDYCYKVTDDGEYFPLYYKDENGEEVEFWFSDLAVNDLAYNPDLYYYETEDSEHGDLPAIDFGVKYNEQNFDFANNEPDVDLRFFFEGTLDEYEASDCLFYSDDNYYFDDEVTGETSTSVGGIFFCTYPDEEILNRCCIMRDYGDNNKRVLKLWEEFKSDNLPLAAIIILIIELGLMVFGLLYYFVGKKAKLQLRKLRKENNK